MREDRITCYFCRHSWTYTPPLPRRAECPSCFRDAKICLNCAFYDRGAHHECREEQAEFVQDKEKGNFCSFFQPLTGQRLEEKADTAKAKLDALFSGAKPLSESPKPLSLADEIARFIASKK
jgi:hypothetical protein